MTQYSNTSPLELFRSRSDEFVTFVYAAAVHLVIAGCIEHNPELFKYYLVFVLFIFIDWISRVWLPRYLPSNDEINAYEQLAKTSLEITGLFLIVLAGLTISHVDGRTNFQSAYYPFAGFLFATFLWNLILLWIMKDAGWWELLSKGLGGTVKDSNPVKIYLEEFEKALDTKKGELKDSNYSQGAIDSISIALIDGFSWFLTQFIAFHITVLSLIGACTLIISKKFADGQPVASIIPSVYSIKEDICNYANNKMIFFLCFLIIIMLIISWHGIIGNNNR